MFEAFYLSYLCAPAKINLSGRFAMIKAHSFHIPVMGIAFTLDTPLKVAPFGIDSVISLIDDILMEQMRKKYCQEFNLDYYEISSKTEDFRAERITAYLNLINDLAQMKFESIRMAGIETGNEIKKYLKMLPDTSAILKAMQKLSGDEQIQCLKENMQMGSIDVNIMTKVDKENYQNKIKLPAEFNDAHAALRGYAKSNLTSSLVFSAGLNPRLYSYIEQFDDFFPNRKGEIRKKIILKVSDYRSAFIQGKFLANKGIWVSEFRIESGLNCGGHAFATDGYLMGPILAEFRDKREELRDALYEICSKALIAKNRELPDNTLNMRVTAQGGVGTAEEHEFLLEHYKLDSIGWGTPFLLVPEATTVDQETRNQLLAAKEKDLYVSNISPLGVPFNTLKGNTKDIEKQSLIDKGRPGSSCQKKFVSLNKEFGDKSICTASRVYQHLKITELKEQDLPLDKHNLAYNKIVEKACICVGLGTSSLLVNDLETRGLGTGVSICPGPNMAYFSKELSLEEMLEHIYGKSNSMLRKDRPNFLMKELKLYLIFLKNKLAEVDDSSNAKQVKYLTTFILTMNNGVDYYTSLFENLNDAFASSKNMILEDLRNARQQLEVFANQLQAQPVEM